MKFVEGTSAKTVRELITKISVAMMEVPEGRFMRSPISNEPYRDFEGTFYALELGLANLRRRLGDAKADQTLEMINQAKIHYEAGDAKLGGALLEDTKMFLMSRKPWAYPPEMYSWRVDSSLPEVSEADLLNKDDLER